MVETVFVALFVVLPLALAVLFLLYRARFFLRNMLLVGLAAFGVWGALKIASADFGIFDRRTAQPAYYQPASCFTPDPAVRRDDGPGCAL